MDFTNQYKNKKLIYLTILTVIVFIISYFSNLDGDPSYLKRIGDYGDEGYWLQNAINKCRYDNYLIDDQSQPFFGAPLFNFLLYIVFSVFGISFLSARLFSILCLFVSLIVVYKILQLFIKQKNIIIQYVLLYLILYENRINYQWCTPVNLEIVFQLSLIYFVLKYKLSILNNLILVACIFLACYLSKATSILILPIIISVIIIDNKNVDIIKIFLFLFLAVTPIILLNNFFYLNYKIKFIEFQKLSKVNLLFSYKIMILSLMNFIGNFLKTFKYPNSVLIVFIPLFYVVEKVRLGSPRLLITPRKLLTKLKSLDRVLIILFCFISIYIFELILTGNFGIDRRQINLIPIWYIFFVFILENGLKKYRNDKFKLHFFNIIVLILIFVHQSNNLISQLNCFNLYVYIALFCFLAFVFFSIFYFKFKYIFQLILISNLFFHVLFNRNSKTLIQNSLLLKSNSNYTNEITGIWAHHLSVVSDLYPIWHVDSKILKNYPEWNKNHVWLKNNLVVITDRNRNIANGFVRLDYFSKQIYHTVKIDTLYFYPIFGDNSKYDDTLYAYYIKNIN